MSIVKHGEDWLTVWLDQLYTSPAGGVVVPKTLNRDGGKGEVILNPQVSSTDPPIFFIRVPQRMQQRTSLNAAQQLAEVWVHLHFGGNVQSVLSQDRPADAENNSQVNDVGDFVLGISVDVMA
eukprot:Blabericola_migrator_1__6396@NODE_3223_length_1935_cov_5_731263_g2017_i0_p1_GENE_NODE_3223_length_1935_cov_5_731263_g2017_i0NODE_3223_length_1935_cov_5_731263_g2017_i0_p1_ORF_typecomplete_len123_score11_01_NODE_3223_length_1935_cov_5_731263_g2017_i013461714